MTEAARALISKDNPPVGNPNPLKTSLTKQDRYVRDAQVIAWVKDNADGTCELCRHQAPFCDVNNEPFLEVHHVRFMSENGGDTPENAVAVCPNCHKNLHFGKDKLLLKNQLYENTERLKA